MTYDYSELMSDFRTGDFGDAWGHTLHYWFTVADEIYFNRDNLEVPDEWEFRPSPIGPQNEADDYATELVSQADDESLMRFGKLLNRYAGILKKAGRNY